MTGPTEPTPRTEAYAQRDLSALLAVYRAEDYERFSLLVEGLDVDEARQLLSVAVGTLTAAQKVYGFDLRYPE